MHLQEEYLQRHGLTGVPFIPHANSVAVVLDARECHILQARNVILTVGWRDSGNRPGYYAAEILTPIHDGGQEGANFHKRRVAEVPWDEYEDFFLNWPPKVVVGDFRYSLKDVRAWQTQPEATLALWEMFWFVHDTALTEKPFELREAVAETLNRSLSVEARTGFYQRGFRILSEGWPNIAKTWKHDFNTYAMQFQPWLAKLIGR